MGFPRREWLLSIPLTHDSTKRCFFTYCNAMSKLHGKTILITGAGGMLGQGFIEALSTDLRFKGARVTATTRKDLDVTDRTQVLTWRHERPDFILHCAGYVHADACETDFENCQLANVDGVLHVAELACETQAKLFFPQSFLVFKGGEDVFAEDAEPSPLCKYAVTKAMAEARLLAVYPQALVVRMGGFFGGETVDKNFVGKFVRHVFQLIDAGTSSYQVGERVWQPSYTLDLAKNILYLLAHNKTGVYHMACHGETSFYELARRIVSHLGLSQRIDIQPSPLGAISEKAVRPARCVIINRRLQKENLDQQRPWDDALREYLGRPYFQDLIHQRLTK